MAKCKALMGSVVKGLTELSLYEKAQPAELKTDGETIISTVIITGSYLAGLCRWSVLEHVTYVNGSRLVSGDVKPETCIRFVGQQIDSERYRGRRRSVCIVG